MNQDKVVSQLKDWANSNDEVRGLVLTSSRGGSTNAVVDQFSDYDVVLYVNNLDSFRNDSWLDNFGNVLVKWPLLPESELGENWITRLVIFENRTRIDFQITIEIKTPPFDSDFGYQVIVDKDGFTNNFPKPTGIKHLIEKPTEKEFVDTVNAFFWDATYVPKYLYRNDLFYTKYMFDDDLRFFHFEKMIEWYIGSQHNWQVNTNVHGRGFPKYLDDKTWKEIEATFAGADREETFEAFFKIVDVFTSMAKAVAKSCGYPYPDEQEIKMRKYFLESRKMYDETKN